MVLISKWVIPGMWEKKFLVLDFFFKFIRVFLTCFRYGILSTIPFISNTWNFSQNVSFYYHRRMYLRKLRNLSCPYLFFIAHPHHQPCVCLYFNILSNLLTLYKPDMIKKYHFPPKVKILPFTKKKSYCILSLISSLSCLHSIPRWE